MDINRIGNVTIERVSEKKDEDNTKMNFSDTDSETSISDDENTAIKSDTPSNTSSQSVKRKHQFQIDNSITKKTKNEFSDLLNPSAVSEESRLHSDNEDSEYDSEEDTDTEEQQQKPEDSSAAEAAEESIEAAIEAEKPEEKLDSSDYDYDITEKLKEMGEISVETVKKGEKLRPTTEVDVENEISVTPAKRDSGSDSELSSEKKIGNMRRNIREVMDETQLDEATLAAQRQEMERLRRVQEQQRIIREVQRQIALNRQNTKTQHRVISLLQGNSSLIKNLPSSSKDASFSGSAPSGASVQPSPGASGSKIGGTVLVKLPNGETKPMTRITKSGAPFEVVRLQKGALQGGKVQRNFIPIKKNAGSGNLTPSVSIAPVSKKIEPKIESDSDSEFSDSEKKVRKVAGKPKDVVTISSSSDDDCIVLSEEEPEEPEPDEDPCNSGMHTNDAYNVPDEQGRVLINVGHPENEAPIFLAPQIARVIKPHQIGGVRFLYDNVIESTDRFSTSTGFGCILAHSMGLGKTLQIVCFSDIFLRHTDAKTILCIMPINTLQNWLAEYNMWLPKDPVNSPLLSHGDVRPRNFNLYVLNDSHKNLAARAKVIQEWHKDGGVLLIGYELYRLLSLKRNPKSKKKKKPAGPDRPDTPEDDEKNKTMFDEIHEALVKPGPDLVICDEGHRIKNSHASISQALKQIRSKRRIVLTGYPLQNNLLEYWCMVDFVRPNYLGTKTEFSNMFERPIQNGQCIDSTPQDIRLMRYRAHVLHSLLEGFVQRRSHAVLQTSLPQKEEYVLLVRMTEFQRKLYDTFMNEVVRTKTVPNPLKAFAVCCKIWNHPDVLYYFLKKQTADEAVDLDLEEVAAGVAGAVQTTPKKKKSSRSKAAKKEPKKGANAKNTTKPAASIVPNTSTTTVTTTSATTTCTTQNIPPTNSFPPPQPPPNTQNYQQINQPHNQPINQSINQPMNQPINQPINQPLNQPLNQNYPNTAANPAPYPYSGQQHNYNYPQNGEYYNQNTSQNYPNYYPNNYPTNQEYGSGFYPDKTEGYSYNNEQNYWQNNQQNQYYQQNANGPTQNDYYQQNYNNQQDYYRQNQYPNQNYGQYPQQQQQQQQNAVVPYSQNNCWPAQKTEYPDYKPELNIDKKEENTEEDKMNIDEDKDKEEFEDKDVDIKNAELTAAALVKKEDPSIPYDWAHELMKGYIPGCIENSAKMEIFFCILQESIALGDRILLFSQSLFTLNLIEEFLQKSDVPGSTDKWAKGKQYYRLDGSTSALEREKLINEYNSNPNIHLFLVSTRAGSLGINLVGANRVIVFDASWNPCHDTQAVCRVYRYGQKKPCFVYRIVMDNCLEKKIYDRQINKQGMADRVVDECNPDAHLSMKDVTNLCWDDEKESEVKDFSTTKDKYIDVVMQRVLDAFSTRLSKEPFQHESLLIDRKEKKLSQAEKRLAKRSYELEKQANINSRPTYSYYNSSGSGQGLQIRAIRSADGSLLQNKPVASVRPMQSENMNLNRSGASSTGARSRWIPAEVWQRQGMTAQEMTLPLDVVIPTNSPDRGSIVLKAGQKVLVLKSPKGIYMQLECGKIVAIKTAFKVRGGKTAGDNKDEPKDATTPTTILKKVQQGGTTKNVPLPLKNNTAITVIPKQKVVKPFTQQKFNMRSIRQPVPNLVGRQVPHRLGGGPRFTGKIQSIHRKVQLAKAKPYNMDKSIVDPVKIKTEPLDTSDIPDTPDIRDTLNTRDSPDTVGTLETQETREPQSTNVVPSSDEEVPQVSDKKPESPESGPDCEPFPPNETFSEGERGDHSDLERPEYLETENVSSFAPFPQSFDKFDAIPPPIPPSIPAAIPPPISAAIPPAIPPQPPQIPPQIHPQIPSQISSQKLSQISPTVPPTVAPLVPPVPPLVPSVPQVPPQKELEQLPPLVETKKPAFQVQNTPMPISSAIVHESPANSRSLKNYRHNFAGQKATKTQIKSSATSSAIHQLEQTTCSIGESKQPFQESLDNITNSYGADAAKHDENIINLDEKNDEPSDKSSLCSTKPLPPNKPFPQPPTQTKPDPQPAPTQPLPLPQPPRPLQQPQQPQNVTQQQQDFPPSGYSGYYGYGPPPVQPYPAQNYYPAPEANKDEKEPRTEETAAVSQVSTPVSSSVATVTTAGASGPSAGGFAPYGPPHGSYDMMYGQQNQYNNYPGLYPPNQGSYQGPPGPPYQQQYDQGYPGTYSAFHQYPTDPYGQYRNYHPPPPPQYSYPPGYEYNYNAGGFPPPGGPPGAPPPPPPPFAAPPYSNNPVP